LLGGGGAFCGIILIFLVNASVRFWQEQSLESLLALTSVILYTIAGIVNPYWEGAAFILVMFLAHPFASSIKVKLV
jgi:hypothetical protein